MGKEVNVGFRAMGKEEGFECFFLIKLKEKEKKRN